MRVGGSGGIDPPPESEIPQPDPTQIGASKAIFRL